MGPGPLVITCAYIYIWRNDNGNYTITCFWPRVVTTHIKTIVKPSQKHSGFVILDLKRDCCAHPRFFVGETRKELCTNIRDVRIKKNHVARIRTQNDFSLEDLNPALIHMDNL